MALTEKLKVIAWQAFLESAKTHYIDDFVNVLAAVEAVLAAEQRLPDAIQHNLNKIRNSACDMSSSALDSGACAEQQPNCIPAVPQVPEYVVTNGQWSQPAQPPAGDVVERVAHAIKGAHNEYHPTRADYMQMASIAIAIAREGYVSLEERDAQWEKAIRVEATRVLYGPKAAETFLTSVRARLAKPAEQTDEGVTVHKDSNDWWIVEKYDSAYGKFAEQDAAERYAAGLREELEAGKQ